MPGVLCSLLASFSETTHTAVWHPLVKPLAPAALLVVFWQEKLLADTCKVEADA